MEFTKLITGMVKTVGIIAAVCSGLIIGKEGPLIHIGAVIGANLATLQAFPTNKFTLRYRNDQKKRDFVSAGGAAGVAGAFGSPIGGILFAIEEAAT